MQTYWKLHPRNFANEYIIGIATSAADAEQYQAEGFMRINRETALDHLSFRPESHQQLFRTVTIDGESAGDDCYLIARNIRKAS
jgi:hypothetical protein